MNTIVDPIYTDTFITLYKLKISIFSVNNTEMHIKIVLFFFFSPALHQSTKYKTKKCTVQCTRNEDCYIAEACYNGVCRLPCDVQDCAPNAQCVNVNHKSDCKCVDGFTGNGFISCEPGNFA